MCVACFVGSTSGMRVKSVTKTAALVDGAVKHTVPSMLAVPEIH